MLLANPRRVWTALGLLALVLLGAMGLAERERQQRLAAFETEARIAHRLLSQRATQHETMLATLALLQPGGGATGAEAAPEQRLPALVPQLQRVWRRARGETWASPVLAAAEARALASRHAVLAEADFAAGHFTLLQAALPQSFALQFDLAALVPAPESDGAAASPEWTLPRAGAVRVQLAHGGATWLWAPGRPTGGPWQFQFRKVLASGAQPFELQLSLSPGWGALPWLAMGAWAAVVLAAAWGVAGLVRGRQDRRRAQDLLRLGQVGRLNALGELAAGMAHELNQPLTAVLASTQAAQRLLAEDPPELDTARQALARTVQQARRASEVLNRLRRTVERPGHSAPPSALRVEPALRSALDLLRPELDALAVAVQVRCEPAALQVLAEPVALEQILHNLLSNALQALALVPAGQRELRLSATVAPRSGAGVDAGSGQVQVEVADTGPGIAPELLPRLFEPFFTTREGGLGLGLSLCETLASGLGGSLVARPGQARGATFVLSLPRAVGSGLSP